jgi:hypothetical protein
MQIVPELHQFVIPLLGQDFVPVAENRSIVK